MTGALLTRHLSQPCSAALHPDKQTSSSLFIKVGVSVCHNARAVLERVGVEAPELYEPGHCTRAAEAGEITSVAYCIRDSARAESP